MEEGDDLEVMNIIFSTAAPILLGFALSGVIGFIAVTAVGFLLLETGGIIPIINWVFSSNEGVLAEENTRATIATLYTYR